MNAQDQARFRQELHDARRSSMRICEIVARAIQPVLPHGFSAKVQFVVDNGVLTAENVTVEIRIPRGPKRM